MVKVFFTVGCTLLFFVGWSQERCGTVAYEKLRSLRNPGKETIDQFESWIKEKMAQKSAAFKIDRVENSYVIPVVVHVIHNGELIGNGSNISDAQILSQIPVLNNDFKRLNADTTKIPDEFKPIAGKMNLTFVLAKQDPNGLATTGIVRVKGSQTSWSISDNYTLKSQSYWPTEDYLNLWVTNLTGGLLGYTQLPVSSTLQGLTDTSNDRLTDGVVVDYSAFGTVQASGGSGFNLQSEYNLGRTVTHEVGHFFGLRHVWGDVNSCDPSVSTDFVADTPIQNTDYNGLCPTGVQIECGVHTMYDNYLNYTDDACMNIFSQGQVSRMDVIINNSPRRVSLLASPGSQAPMSVANDLGIKLVVAPGTTACSGDLIPSLVIRNYGSNTIDATQIQFLLNGTSIETKSFSPLNLSPFSETQVSFSSVAVSAGLTYNFSFKILQTNGLSDGNNGNDALSISTQVPTSASLPLRESFDVVPVNAVPAGWQIVNTDDLITWKNISLSGSNHAMYLDFYNYGDDENLLAPDLLVTPVLDLSSAPIASLSFDYAYATFSGGSNDRLRVLVSTVCDFNSSPVEIFNKSGSALATAPPSGALFTPTSSQWATSTITLNQFLGKKIQIGFEGVNGYGNDLYLDNVLITTSSTTAFELTSLVSPSPVSCQTIAQPIIAVRNTGNTTINSFTAKIYTNDQLTVEQISGLQLDIGASQNITLSPSTFESGRNSLAVAIQSPNGLAMTSASNDSIQTSLLINSASDFIPLRENFEENYVGEWSIISPHSNSNWSATQTNKSISLGFHSFGNADLGEQSWLVSPVLNFSKAQNAGVFFETSYAYNPPGSETLQVFSSTDCGVTFDKLLFTKSGIPLSNVDSTISWVPSQNSHWTKNYINLDSLAKKEDVRLAFVVTNDDGNNLYIDDIEIFTDDLQSHDTVTGLYSVYGGAGTPVKVTFNLPEKQLVRLQAYDMLGHVVTDNLLAETLNQTYIIDLPEESRGLYIIRVQTATSLSSTKVLFGF